MHHHYKSLGGWTFAFSDYIDLNITAYVDDPKMQNLAKIVDPYCKLLSFAIMRCGAFKTTHSMCSDKSKLCSY